MRVRSEDATLSLVSHPKSVEFDIIILYLLQYYCYTHQVCQGHEKP